MKKRETLPFLKHPAYQKLLKIMKLSSAFLLLACLHVHAGTYSQERITIKLQAADIKKALNTIERKSSYRFLYNESLLSKKAKVNIEATNEEVTSILNQIFQGTGIGYRILQNNLVVLRMAEEAANIKELRITGQVIASDGRPLAGVSV